MELQYLQKLKELENHFITDNKQAMILSTFDEESIANVIIISAPLYNYIFPHKELM